ncbi:hypothetical protein OROMI_016755 [Orobanche minor]
MASRPSPLDPLLAALKELKEAVQPSVVALKCFFSAPENGEFQKCSRIGAGVFVDRKLILTSAHVAGMISTVRDSERGTTVHNCFIGRTVAVTNENKVLKTKLLAADFSGDVAVLDVEGEVDLPPPCAVSRSSACKELPLLVITRHGDCNGGSTIQMKVKCMEDNSGRTDWPYDLEDGLGWERYGGAPIDELKIVPGSPWFSFLHRQVVGIASTAVGGETVGSVGGFVVPPLRIRSVLDYAKTKSPLDPIALDPWINTLTFADSDADGCYENVPVGLVVSTYLY